MGKSIIDEAYVELEKVRIDTKNERNEKDRLVKEVVRLSSEIAALDKKRINIVSYIKEKEETLSIHLKEKEGKAEQLLKSASLGESEARSTLDVARKKEAEAEALKTRLKAQIDNVNATLAANTTIMHELKDIVKIINEKLGKL